MGSRPLRIVAVLTAGILGLALSLTAGAGGESTDSKVRSLILKRRITGLDHRLPVPSALTVLHRRLRRLHLDALNVSAQLSDLERRRAPAAVRLAAHGKLVKSREAVIQDLRRHKEEIDRSSLRAQTMESLLVDDLVGQIAAAARRLLAVDRLVEWAELLKESVGDLRAPIPDPPWPPELDPVERRAVETTLNDLRHSPTLRDRRQTYRQLIRALETFRKTQEHAVAELQREVLATRGLRDTRDGRMVILAELVNECIRLNERFNVHDREVIARLED